MILRALVGSLALVAGCSGGASSADFPTVPSTILLPTATAGPTSMFVGGLDATSVNHGNTWLAHVTVTVLDESGEAAAGVLVSASWNAGETGTTSCTTDPGGSCDLESGSIRKRVASVDLEIIGLEHGSLVHSPEPGAVDDPKGVERSITIRKP